MEQEWLEHGPRLETVVIATNNDVCLMILEKEKIILPVSPLAFHVTQNCQNKLDSYQGAIVVDRTGVARVVRKVDIVGYYGESIWQKLVSALFGVKKILVHFDADPSIDLERFKFLITFFIGLDSERNDPFLPQSQKLSAVVEMLRTSNSFQDIFDSLDIPSIEDCLDVL